MFEMVVKRVNSKIHRCQFGVVVRNIEDMVVGACYSNLIELPSSGDLLKIRYSLNNHNLAKGRYKLNFNIANYDYSAVVRDYDVVQNVIRFDVTHLDKEHRNPFTYWSFKGSVCYQNADVIVENAD